MKEITRQEWHHAEHRSDISVRTVRTPEEIEDNDRLLLRRMLGTDHMCGDMIRVQTFVDRGRGEPPEVLLYQADFVVEDATRVTEVYEDTFGGTTSKTGKRWAVRRVGNWHASTEAEIREDMEEQKAMTPEPLPEAPRRGRPPKTEAA